MWNESQNLARNQVNLIIKRHYIILPLEVGNVGFAVSKRNMPSPQTVQLIISGVESLRTWTITPRCVSQPGQRKGSFSRGSRRVRFWSVVVEDRRGRYNQRVWQTVDIQHYIPSRRKVHWAVHVSVGHKCYLQCDCYKDLTKSAAGWSSTPNKSNV